jgi:putative ABC transport system permease protein
MNDLLYLSGQYIRHHKNKLLILIFAITLVSWLPIAIQTIVDQTAEQLLDRANNTPLVIGAPGSPLELALGSLYFRTQAPETLNFGELKKVEATGFARAIPLYYRFNSQGHPIVGTNPDYLEFRKLQFAQGRPAALLGEAVLGADVARALKLAVGDFVISSPENVFDIAGVYPLKMPVVGILEPAFSPDDQAIFVDIKTSWVIQGLGHGHQDLNTRKAAGQVLKKEGSNIVANASVRQFNEITPDNIASFHFHGDNSQHPISAIIPVAKNDKAAALLIGIYQEERDDIQIVRSQRVITELLDTVFTVRNYIIIGIAAIAVATAIIALLVFLLSLRLRQGERFTLARIGASQTQIFLLMATEIITVLLVSAGLSALLIIATQQFGMQLLQQLLLT